MLINVLDDTFLLSNKPKFPARCLGPMFVLGDLFRATYNYFLPRSDSRSTAISTLKSKDMATVPDMDQL